MIYLPPLHIFLAISFHARGSFHSLFTFVWLGKFVSLFIILALGSFREGSSWCWRATSPQISRGCRGDLRSTVAATTALSLGLSHCFVMLDLFLLFSRWNFVDVLFYGHRMSEIETWFPEMFRGELYSARSINEFTGYCIISFLARMGV